jgi:ATP-binding cassette subfamily F protein 3
MQGPIAAVPPAAAAGGEERPKWTPKELRRLRSEVIAQRSRALRPLETRIAAVEKDIECRDAALRDLNGQLVKASQDRQGTKVVEVSKAMHQTKKAIDGLLEELEKLTAAHEEKKAGYDKRMRELDEEGEV